MVENTLREKVAVRASTRRFFSWYDVVAGADSKRLENPLFLFDCEKPR